MIKLLKKLNSKEWASLGVCVLMIVLGVYLDLKLPDYMSEITKLVTTGSYMSDIWLAGGKMLLCAVGSLITSCVVALIVARVSSSFSARLRELVFTKVQSFSMEEIGDFSTSSLITRTTNDVTQVQMTIVMGLQSMIKAPVLAIWAICKIVGKSWQWSTATAVAVVILLLVVVLCVTLALPKFKKLQLLTDNLNSKARENITGIGVVRAYNAENYEEEKFEKANTHLAKTHLFTGNVMSFMMPSVQAVINGLALAIYFIGAVIINNAVGADKLNLFADMIVFSSYAMQILMAFMMLIMIFIMLPRAIVSAGRINEVLNTENKIRSGSFNGKTELKGEIEFKNVSFKYPDAEEEIIKNINFTAKQGETVALIGATGSGKTTVINLIPRFYDVTSGEILINNVPIKDYKIQNLRNKIGYVSQTAVMFSGTIKSNIAFGDNGSDNLTQGIENSLELAEASEFVNKTENGINAYVSAGGKNFSGGQKQRLSIARAINRKPEILIFDDSFSALDYKTDKVLRKKLNDNLNDVTKIIVAQRIGTIIDADKILVIEDGEIVGEGKHKELLENCEVYKEIALSQLSKEEL